MEPLVARIFGSIDPGEKWNCPFLAAKNLLGRNRNPQATKPKGNPAADDGV